jgi:rsbT co-antagonist protein RsbR
MSKEEERLRQRVIELEHENTDLRGQLRLLNQSLDAAVDGITIADATLSDMPLIYVNPAFERVTGYSVDEVIGHNCRFLQGPDTDQAAVETIRAALRKQEPCQVTLLNYRKDGSPFWNSFSISPIRNDVGKVTHYVGIQVDITQQKNAELALKESETRISRIIESAMDGIITIDSQQRIILINSAAETMFGYTARTIQGHSLTELIPTSFREKHHEHVTAFGQTDIANRHMGQQRVVSGLRANGNEFPIEASISQVDVGNQKLYTVIVRDVTDRIQAEEERSQLQEDVIRMQHALVQELSTPLIPITDDIVIMPLVGSVDSLRAQNVMETLLKGIEKNRARIAILDITGVPIVDTQVANTLIQSAQAIRLLGAKVLLTGIGPEIAQTLVGLGVDLSSITTHSTLQSGITYAIQSLRRQQRN